MKANKKLILKKEKVASLSLKSLENVIGGVKQDRSRVSSQHWLTCCWCTGTNTAAVDCIKD